jgi:hypothetical protein
MKERKRGKRLHPLDPLEAPAPSQNDDPLTQGEGTRQYDSGKNPAMQAQRSDRQGSGKPTQQRPEDR